MKRLSFHIDPLVLPTLTGIEQHQRKLTFICDTPCSHLLRNPESTWCDVPHLPKSAINHLDDKFVGCSSVVIRKSHSKDGEAAKLLIRLQDGLEIEAVVMKYNYRGGSQDARTSASSASSTSPEFQSQRYTLCVSSQVGCQMGCTFCATGQCPSSY